MRRRVKQNTRGNVASFSTRAMTSNGSLPLVFVGSFVLLYFFQSGSRKVAERQLG